MDEQPHLIIDHDSSVPTLRRDFLRRDIDAEAVVWSTIRPAPAVLDPVATIMLDVLDGVATVAELIDDVHNEVGISREIADAQVRRAVRTFDRAGILSTSAGSDWSELQQEIFSAPPNT